MVVMPDPPDSLPPAPRAFYDGVRAAFEALRPQAIDPERTEIDFGDGGVSVTFPHLREREWVLAAQVSRRAAVVFAGPVTEHFSDEPGGDWTRPAVELVTRVLRGDVVAQRKAETDDSGHALLAVDRVAAEADRGEIRRQ